MKRVLTWPFAWVAGLLAFTALAQQEQWLEYHTTSEPRGYRWLELTTNPPPNVALPKLRAFAYYGQWKNGFDGQRWFCLDRNTKNGACDRLFFDRNGNGRLDDETAINTSRREGSMAYFEPVKVVFKGEDGPISYHLLLRFYQFDSDRAQLLAAAGGWYEGMANIAGKKRRVQLFDNTVNGAFNDQSTAPADCDRIVVSGDPEVNRYLGRYLDLGGELLRIEVARDGAFIKTQKAEGVQFGQVKVPESISEFEAVGECGHFVRKPSKCEFTLPLGKYRVYRWVINRKDDKGTAWTLSGDNFSGTADFEVTSANVASLEIGEPIRPVLQATETKTQVTFSLRLLGTLGESVDIMRGSDRPRAPQLHLASKAGDLRSTNTFEYG